MNFGAKLGQIIEFVFGAANWKPPMERFLRTMDAVVQLNALGFANAPPTSAHGDTYIVGTAPTGAFAGQAVGVVATYHSTLPGWEFYTPLKGWRGYIASDMYYYNGSAWGLEANLPGASAVAAITAQNVAASVAGAAVATHAASGDHDARYLAKNATNVPMTNRAGDPGDPIPDLDNLFNMQTNYIGAIGPATLGNPMTVTPWATVLQFWSPYQRCQILFPHTASGVAPVKFRSGHNWNPIAANPWQSI
jgi:hypothetical protein